MTRQPITTIKPAYNALTIIELIVGVVTFYGIAAIAVTLAPHVAFVSDETIFGVDGYLVNSIVTGVVVLTVSFKRYLKWHKV